MVYVRNWQAAGHALARTFVNKREGSGDTACLFIKVVPVAVITVATVELSSYDRDP